MTIRVLGGLLALFAVVSGAVGDGGTGSLPTQARFPASVQGVTISTHGSGRDWARVGPMMETMRELKRLGVEWIAIHPYAGVSGDGTLRFEIDPAKPPAHVVRPIHAAHELGLKILIKPHLAYWGSPFKWRGDIEFDSDEEWRRFWTGYERWIVLLAEVSREADGFVVGTELDRTLAHQSEWRRIIGQVRERTRAPLTYAANWTDYERVPFWEALDAIGIQAYFPLTEEATTNVERLARGWSERMRHLERFAAQHKRQILFTELGYNRSFNAAVEPWNAKSDGEGAASFQELCMRIALRAIENEPRVVGSFLWKWFPEPYPVGRNFQLATPGMKRVISDAWGGDEAEPLDQSTGISTPLTAPSRR